MGIWQTIGKEALKQGKEYAKDEAKSQAADLVRKASGGQDNSAGQGLADAGSVLNGMFTREQIDRILRGNYTQDYDKLKMQAEEGRNANESDALRKLAITGYLAGGGAKPGASSLQLNGQAREIPNFGVDALPVSEAQKAGANALQAQLVSRLGPGGSYTPTPLETYAEPGAMEDITKKAGYGAAGAGIIADLIKRYRAGDKVQKDAGSTISDMVGTDYGSQTNQPEEYDPYNDPNFVY